MQLPSQATIPLVKETGTVNFLYLGEKEQGRNLTQSISDGKLLPSLIKLATFKIHVSKGRKHYDRNWTLPTPSPPSFAADRKHVQNETEGCVGVGVKAFV